MDFSMLPEESAVIFLVPPKSKKKKRQNTQNQPNKNLKTSVAGGKCENGQTYGTEEIRLARQREKHRDEQGQ